MATEIWSHSTFLYFPVLSKPSVTIRQTTYSKHIWAVIYFHYSALGFKDPSVAKAPLMPAVTFTVATAPVRRTFLHITNMWSTLRTCPQEAIGFKLILDHLSSLLSSVSHSPHTHTHINWKGNVFFKQNKPMRRILFTFFSFPRCAIQQVLLSYLFHM